MSEGFDGGFFLILLQRMLKLIHASFIGDVSTVRTLLKDKAPGFSVDLKNAVRHRTDRPRRLFPSQRCWVPFVKEIRGGAKAIAPYCLL